MESCKYKSFEEHSNTQLDSQEIEQYFREGLPKKRKVIENDGFVLKPESTE